MKKEDFVREFFRVKSHLFFLVVEFASSWRVFWNLFIVVEFVSRWRLIILSPKFCWMFVKWLKEVLKGYEKFWESNLGAQCRCLDAIQGVWNQVGPETRCMSTVITVRLLLERHATLAWHEAAARAAYRFRKKLFFFFFRSFILFPSKNFLLSLMYTPRNLLLSYDYVWVLENYTI